MEKITKYAKRQRGAQKRMSEIEKQINEFYSSNPNIAEAMKLFKISNEEYETAIATIYEPKIYKTNSTNGGVPDGNNLG